MILPLDIGKTTSHKVLFSICTYCPTNNRFWLLIIICVRDSHWICMHILSYTGIYTSISAELCGCVANVGTFMTFASQKGF